MTTLSVRTSNIDNNEIDHIESNKIKPLTIEQKFKNEIIKMVKKNKKKSEKNIDLKFNYVKISDYKQICNLL